MSRTPQPAGTRGSLKWIQRAVGGQSAVLDEQILRALSGSRSIRWLSPLESDGFAEYRDGAFLALLGLQHLADRLKAFWPERGPQWDALGLTDQGEVVLVEAKAHIAEMCSPGTAAGPASRKRIVDRLDAIALELGARSGRAEWADHFYQLANRLAHLAFLRENGAPAFLVLVNFIGDQDMNGPTSPEAWRAAYDVAFHVMGLPKRHKLSRFVIEVFPEVSTL